MADSPALQEQIRQMEAQVQFLEAQTSMFGSRLAVASSDDRAMLRQEEELLQHQLIGLREELATLQQQQRMEQPLLGQQFVEHLISKCMFEAILAVPMQATVYLCSELLTWHASLAADCRQKLCSTTTSGNNACTSAVQATYRGRLHKVARGILAAIAAVYAVISVWGALSFWGYGSNLLGATLAPYLAPVEFVMILRGAYKVCREHICSEELAEETAVVMEWVLRKLGFNRRY